MKLLTHLLQQLFGAAILYLVARDGLPVDVMVFTLVFFYHFLVFGSLCSAHSTIALTRNASDMLIPILLLQVLIVGFVSTNLLLLDVWFYSMCVSVGMVRDAFPPYTSAQHTQVQQAPITRPACVPTDRAGCCVCQPSALLSLSWRPHGCAWCHT